MKFSEYVALGKECIGPGSTDAQLGELLGYAQQTISEAKHGRASDEMALKLGQLLVKHGRLEFAGEVIVVAHAERKSGAVQKALVEYAGKVLRLTASKATAAVLAAVVLCGTLLAPREALAEAVRFELTDGCPSPVFKTGALNRSATLPACALSRRPPDTASLQTALALERLRGCHRDSASGTTHVCRLLRSCLHGGVQVPGQSRGELRARTTHDHAHAH
jgi:hypothetical protein